MADRIRSQEGHDGQRSDWETRQSWKSSRRFRALRSSLTGFEMQVVCMIYYEACTVRETAYILEVHEKAVRRVLWDVTERFLK